MNVNPGLDGLDVVVVIMYDDNDERKLLMIDIMLFFLYLWYECIFLYASFPFT